MRHHSIRHCLPSIVLSGLFLSTAGAQRELRDIPPPDPAVELASFRVADGFEVNLWAADPLLAKPTQISFDMEGRLWVSSSQTYPQLNVNQDPNDRILVLEDTDADGVADRSSVFYDELIIPGGVLPDGRGGAYVAHAEDLIHLSDADGDGNADAKEVLLSGFGTEDTHHTLHRLRWGPGGLLYMLQGYYIGTHVETLYGPRRLNGGGLWSYDTRTRQLEIYSRGLVNPWGVVFDRWGQTFQTDGAGGEGINYSFPDAVFKASPHEYRTLSGLNPGRPKLCGIEVISGRHFPDEWQGNLLANDFRANNIDRYAISESGSGFVSTLLEDLLQSTHVSFRPIDMVMGPDGAVYVADWYSPIIQHGEVDFRDRRRDQIHGRIWRITAKGRPLVVPVDYKKATVDELLGFLKADEDWVRLHAKQELKHRDETEVESAIDRWLALLDPADPDYERHRLEALWAYQTITTRRSLDFVLELLQSPDNRVRAAAVRVAYHWGANPNVLENAIADPHPRVRREAVTALGQFDSEAAASLALGVLDHPMDKYLDFALWRTCRLLEGHWLPAFQENTFDFGDDADRLAFALKAIEKPEALVPLVQMLNDRADAVDASTVRLIGKIGSPEDLNAIVRLVTANGQSQRLSQAAAWALLEAAEDRGVSPADQSECLTVCRQFLSSDDIRTVAAACRLAGHWMIASLKDDLRDQIRGSRPNVSGDVLDAASFALASLGDNGFLIAIAGDSSQLLPVRASAAAALVRIDPVTGSDSVAALLAQAPANALIDGMIGAVVIKKGAPEALARALGGDAIPSATALRAMQLVETSGMSATPLAAALTSAGGLKHASQALDSTQLESLLSDLGKGDPARGEKIYGRTELACAVCHVVNGKGGAIGPDLSSIGASAPADYLIESLLEPSRKIKEGYRMSMVTTKDGDIVSGTIVQDDQNVIVVQNSTGNQIRVPKSSVASRETSPVSMMPSGLTASLREDEFVDLISYLSLLGRQEEKKASDR